MATPVLDATVVIRRPWQGFPGRAGVPIVYAGVFGAFTGSRWLLGLFVVFVIDAVWSAWWTRVELTESHLAVRDRLWRRWQIDWHDVQYVGVREVGWGPRAVVWDQRTWRRLPFPTVGTHKQRQRRAEALEREVAGWWWPRRSPTWRPRPDAGGWPDRDAVPDRLFVWPTLGGMAAVMAVVLTGVAACAVAALREARVVVGTPVGDLVRTETPPDGFAFELGPAAGWLPLAVVVVAAFTAAGRTWSERRADTAA